MKDNTTTQKRDKSTGITVALVGLAFVLLIAAGTRPRGNDAVEIVEQRFPDVDVASMLEGYVGQPVTEHDLTITAAYRAMCIRTLSYLSTASETTRPSEEQLAEMTKPASVLRNFENPQSAAIFDLLVDSMTDGEMGAAADFVTNECDSRREYLNERELADVAHLVDKGAMAQIASDTAIEPGPVGPEGEPAEPE